MGTLTGTVKQRSTDDRAEYLLIERWGQTTREYRRNYWSTLMDWEREVLTDAFGGRDARGK